MPFRPDGGRRDQLWTFTRAWLRARHPDYPIYVGASPEGLFNRSAAINRAATEAGDWDVAVVCDSDTVVPAAQLEQAVATAHRTGLLTSALSKVVELSRESTDLLLSGADADVTRLKKDRTRTKDDLTQSSVLAVPRRLWAAIDGFDEEFCGWGCEDNAFWLAATVVGGSDPIRVQGSAFHLWHELALKFRILDPVFRRNLWRLRRYGKAQTPSQLAALRDA
ncbi:galactosyltransferase-related protein [Mycobacterium sp. NPDC006124]|uniref:glycosyltransferase family 2 protein n=1 Tax=Mycobacterium sp. NPDC006124 TaxID=3156729 RepID=UPI00339E3AA0